jgi:hypothetical protein
MRKSVYTFLGIALRHESRKITTPAIVIYGYFSGSYRNVIRIYSCVKTAHQPEKKIVGAVFLQLVVTIAPLPPFPASL